MRIIMDCFEDWLPIALNAALGFKWLEDRDISFFLLRIFATSINCLFCFGVHFLMWAIFNVSVDFLTALLLFCILCNERHAGILALLTRVLNNTLILKGEASAIGPQRDVQDHVSLKKKKKKNYNIILKKDRNRVTDVRKQTYGYQENYVGGIHWEVGLTYTCYHI